ncbi:MAG: Tol biopolymer transport system component [Pirellulaceae bacterium]|jgi:Tol biopolymer transport system component
MKTIFSILSITLASIAFNASAQTYIYDDAGRLEKIVYDSGKGVAYTYDIRDNLIQVNTIAVPPAVTNLAITASSSTDATLTWQHTGDVFLFLIQSKLKDSDDWVNGASIDDVNARSAAITLTPGVVRSYRIIVFGTNSDESAPSERITLPSQVPLIVTTLDDENDHILGQGRGDSLREVIEIAIDGESIEFAPYLTGGIIVLENGELSVTQDITIDATPLPGRITINAGGNSRIFSVFSTDTVVMKGLRMMGGDASFGGALINNGVNLTLDDCVITDNISQNDGGGIYNWNGGSLLLYQSTVSGNIAPNGGGVFNFSNASLEVVFSTISRNFATDGAGVYNAGTSLKLDRSAFAQNEATHNGGAVFNTGTDALIVNSTIAGNASSDNTGGAISNNASASIILRHSTVATNTGSGIFNNAPATLTLDNSIVASNFNLLNSPKDVEGDYTAIGANIVRTHTGTLLSGPTALKVDPVLGPFASYGGRSHSMPPLVGSPTLDAGIVTANTPSTDQDSSFRPNGAAPELGSIESRLSSETNLEWLTTSAGSLSPVFRPSLTTYTASVPNEMTTVAFRSAKAQSGQTVEIRINEDVYAEIGSKAASSELPLNTGENAVEVLVTAQNGNTTKTYAITVIRGAPNATNTDLASMATSSGVLSPTFDSETLEYNVLVPEGTSTTTVTATTAITEATMQVRANFGDYVTLVSGAASSPLALNIGANPIDIKVTAKDGSTTTIHSITVTREATAISNPLLAALSTSAGPLIPSFNPGVFAYNVAVPDSIDSTTIMAATAQPSASIQTFINGAAFEAIDSGATSSQMTLAPGANLIRVNVTAQDGASLQSYTIIVTRVIDTVDWISQSGNAASTKPSISADGRYVAFASSATNLVGEDTNGNEHIFVYDRIDGTMKLLSESDGGQLGDRNSTDPVISADGKFVAFQSEARNLVPGDENGNSDPSSGRDIFVYDLELNSIERVSLRDNGGESNQASGEPSISGDGRYVAFQSSANNLVSGYAVGNTNVYLYDRNATESKIIGISVPFADIETNRDSLSPAISTDGAYVAFEFSVDKNDDNQDLNYRYTDIHLYSTASGAVERITGTKIGIAADGAKSEEPSISADGRYIAFESNHEDIDFYDTNNAIDIFVYDRVEGTTRRVSANGSTGGQMFKDSTNPSLSGDGRFVAFESMASNLVDLDTNNSIDIFMTDLATGEIALASVNDAGVQGDDYSYLPSLSYDGRSMAFQSAASNMVPEDAGAVVDIFVAETDSITPSSLADLSSLTTNLGTLSKNGNTFTATVSENLGTFEFEPFVADLGATIEASVNSAAFVSLPFTTTSVLDLAPGENEITIKVTAADGSTTETYDLEIVRTVIDDAFLYDADLIALTTNVGSLTPTFASSSLSYSTVVSNDTNAATITPTLSGAGATVTINGTAVASGSASEAINLSVGSNIFITTITAQDGVTKKTYALAITRIPAELVPEEETIAITNIEYIDGSPARIRVTWQSEAGATYTIEKSTGLTIWATFGSDIASGGATTTTDIELEIPTPDEIFLRLKIK